MTKAKNAEAMPAWIPKKTEVLATAANLVRLGFLDAKAIADRDIQAIEAGKAEFVRVFPNQKAVAAGFIDEQEFKTGGDSVKTRMAALRRGEKIDIFGE